MKNLVYALLIGLSVMGLAMEYSTRVTNDISDNVIRLHILANSDSAEDQSLKLKVRDRVAGYLGGKLGENDDIAGARKLIYENLDGIKAVANEEIKKNGYAYEVGAQLGRFDFPTRHYENFSLPEGDYEALRITIGDGGGANWWCVVYPNLCFVDKTVQLPDDSMEKLSGVLSEDELKLISSPSDMGVQLKFRIVELLSL